MFQVVFSIASRFLHLGNMLQGFARGIFALRNLQIISSHLIPALPAPSPALLLDTPVSFVEFPEKIISSYSSAIIAIEPQHSVFSSSIPTYQSSLITVMPSQLPNLVPLFIMLAIIIISGSIVLLPLYFFVNIAKNTSAIAQSSQLFVTKSFNAKPIFNLVPAGLPCQLPSFQLLISLFSLLLLWTGPPAIAFFFTLIWVISSLFSRGQSLDMIVTILQRCGLLTIQDTQTPPFLTAMYEQITRTTEYDYRDLAQCEDLSNEHKNGQVITDSSPGYSHLATRLRDHGSNPRDALAPRKSSQRDARTRELEAERRRLRVEHIHAKLSNSQRILRQQLEALRAREEKSRADPVIEKECQKSKVLVSASEAPDKERRRWEQLAATAKAQCAEAENTAFKLQVDLTVAIDRNRDIQEKLDHQLTLASDNAHVVQSIMEGSQVAHTKLKCAEDKIARLENELQQEKDRRPCETKKILDKQGHDAEIRRVAAAQEPQSTQEKIAALRHLMSQLREELSRPDDARPPKYRPRPRTGPVDTGQPPRPPERLLDAPLPPAPSPSSPLYSIKSPRHSPGQDSKNPSSYPTACLLQISACFGQPPDDVAKAQRAALEELIQRMREPESESTPDAKPSERDRARLEEELVEAKEQLRLAGEETLSVRRDLDQSIEVLIEVETYARALRISWSSVWRGYEKLKFQGAPT
ncbi:hypothetical protein BC826DRAFT_608177 [Russula brevipes]|nr:hypothetical protein BC826DRAFT_608177 [Russula brevipes]